MLSATAQLPSELRAHVIQPDMITSFPLRRLEWAPPRRPPYHAPSSSPSRGKKWVVVVQTTGDHVNVSFASPVHEEGRTGVRQHGQRVMSMAAPGRRNNKVHAVVVYDAIRVA